MPAVAIVATIAVDVAAEAAATSVITSIAAGTILTTTTVAGGIALSTIGAVAAGAIAGLAGGVVSAAITGGDMLTSALEGAAGGAIGGGIQGLSAPNPAASEAATISGGATGVNEIGSGGLIANAVKSVSDALNVPVFAVNAVAKAVGGAAAGAIGSAAAGQNPGTGALGGAISGGVGSGLGAVVGSNVDFNAVAQSTGLPVDMVKAIITGLGKAATGTLSAAATGGNEGLSALAGFASGTLPTAVKAAEDAAKNVYDSVTSGAQDAITQITNDAQTQLTQIQQGLDQQGAALQDKVQQAQAQYQQALDAVNAHALPPGFSTQGGQFIRQIEDLRVSTAVQQTMQNYNLALQNLQAVTADTQNQWSQIQSQADAQAQQITDSANQQIAEQQQTLSGALDQATRAFQNFLVSPAEAATPQGGPDPLASSNYPSYASANDAANAVASAYPNVGDAQQFFIAQSSNGQFYVVPKSDLNTNQALNDWLTKNSSLANPNASSMGPNGLNVEIQATPPILLFGRGSPEGGRPSGGGGGPAGTPSAPSDAGSAGVTTSDTGTFNISPQDRMLADMAGLSTPSPGDTTIGQAQSQNGTQPSSATNPQDRQIMDLAGITAPPKSPQSAGGGATAPTPGGGSAAGGGGEKGGGGQGQGGAGQGGGGVGDNLDFSSGAVGGTTGGPPIPGQEPQPGSAALAQALALPGLGYAPGSSVFGVLGKRTPVWNKQSLRAEDTSGV